MHRKLPQVLQASLLAGAMMVAMVAPAQAQTEQPGGASMPKVGEMAPDFKLNYFDGTNSKEVSLSQYRGKKNVVLGFFIFAFTGG
ncbi:MAG: hypothetical protein JWN63_2064 [Candidatus Acidoferrum typicum]|jgi:hypothetical protein|nr:hypothetical protein [Candidatus Acidoferrum typicum]